MRIKYVIPLPMGKTHLGKKEIERRQAKLRGWAFDGTQIDIVAVDNGPVSLESMYGEYLSVPATAQRIVEAQREGYDAAIVGCFGDPGLAGFRELCKMLVVGPAAASISMAICLGHRFSILAATDGFGQSVRRLVWESGALDKFASVRVLNTPMMEINRDHESAICKMIEAGKKAIYEDGADVLILGCLSMGFLDVAEMMMDRLSVPVINPAKVALKTAEALVGSALSHSKRAYITPEEIAAGATLQDMYIK